MARKQWRIVYPGSPEADTFTSEREMHEFVDSLRLAWSVGASTGSLTVQVDEGTGWKTCDHVDFATESGHV